jgi:GNAT superfamily N-acetyltransferase
VTSTVLADSKLIIRRIETESELRAIFSLVVQLRPRVASGSVEAFIAQFRRQEADGYVAAAGCVNGKPVVYAGYRPACTLARGPHLFVDDFVTEKSAHGRGYGRAMLRWLARDALDLGLDRVHLDSRDTARGFYEKVAFEFSTSIPCSIDAHRLLGE